MFEKPSNGNLPCELVQRLICRDGYYFPSVKNIVHEYNISICRHEEKGQICVDGIQCVVCTQLLNFYHQ
jgi:hypothetical protein